ncbi:hypothetical protein ABZ383_32540 [Streptomyces sp. NPDC005900]|uniref:hypothetical protein n=1 Tax=Streptomyces sp. NPDC005900 TaxID=3154569 RepID=UPI0033D9B20F
MFERAVTSRLPLALCGHPRRNRRWAERHDTTLVDSYITGDAKAAEGLNCASGKEWPKPPNACAETDSRERDVMTDGATPPTIRCDIEPFFCPIPTGRHPDLTVMQERAERRIDRFVLTPTDAARRRLLGINTAQQTQKEFDAAELPSSDREALALVIRELAWRDR